jgi:hypothetical protein
VSNERNKCPLADSKMSPKDKLRLFGELYEENKDRLRMAKDTNFPMNYKKGLQWAHSHCDTESIRFAEAIISNTVYISFGEFMRSLEKICGAFKRYYAERQDVVFVLILPFDMSKSNIWVSLLVYPWLKDILHDIDFNITSVYNKYASLGDGPKKSVVCIVCDDCAYTGNQLMSYCTLQPDMIAYPGKPNEPSPNSIEWIGWHKQITEHTAQLEASIDKSMFSINLIIPYISTHAQENIAGHKFLMVPRDAQVFKLFRERVPIHEFNQGSIREFESTFQYHSNISAIYFDHKIADAISTFNKIYLMAPIFGCGSMRKSACFIDGCTNQRRDVPEGVNIYDVHMNIEDELKGRVCPPTYYKSIKYTLKGKPISSLCVYAIFA